MRVKYFYSWGYFHPITCGADQVAANHLRYFRDRGDAVDVLVVNDPRKRAFAGAFREQYGWVSSVTEVDPPVCPFSFRDMVVGYDEATRQEGLRAALQRPADLFLTNYVFTTPLVAHLPRDCRRVLETVDIMTHQFALDEQEAAARARRPVNPLRRAFHRFSIQTELELYRLYDAAVMISEEELRYVRGCGVGNAYYVPQLTAGTAPAPEAPEHAYDYDLLFIGSDAPINVRGITWFYRHVYVPHLWRHGVRLAVVGGVCRGLDFRDANIALLHRVEGPLDALYAGTKLCVVPIFEGTGLSIKTLEGLSQGRPLVAAPAGCRGLDDTARAYVKLDMKASPRQTADAILRLLADRPERLRLRERALGYVRRQFNWECYRAAMDRVMNDVFAPERRLAAA